MVISELNLTNCKQIKIYSGRQLPSCSLENCNEVQVNLNNATKACKLYTTCARAVVVAWPKDGADDSTWDIENYHRFPVQEIYESTIKGDVLDTVASEPLE